MTLDAITHGFGAIRVVLELFFDMYSLLFVTCSRVWQYLLIRLLRQDLPRFYDERRAQTRIISRFSHVHSLHRRLHRQIYRLVFSGLRIRDFRPENPPSSSFGDKSRQFPPTSPPTTIPGEEWGQILRHNPPSAFSGRSAITPSRSTHYLLPTQFHQISPHDPPTTFFWPNSIKSPLTIHPLPLSGPIPSNLSSRSTRYLFPAQWHEISPHDPPATFFSPNSIKSPLTVHPLPFSGRNTIKSPLTVHPLHFPSRNTIKSPLTVHPLPFPSRNTVPHGSRWALYLFLARLEPQLRFDELKVRFSTSQWTSARESGVVWVVSDRATGDFGSRSRVQDGGFDETSRFPKPDRTRNPGNVKDSRNAGVSCRRIDCFEVV
jgi:hypothetical protein